MVRPWFLDKIPEKGVSFNSCPLIWNLTFRNRSWFGFGFYFKTNTLVSRLDRDLQTKDLLKVQRSLRQLRLAGAEFPSSRRAEAEALPGQRIDPRVAGWYPLVGRSVFFCSFLFNLFFDGGVLFFVCFALNLSSFLVLCGAGGVGRVPVLGRVPVCCFFFFCLDIFPFFLRGVDWRLKATFRRGPPKKIQVGIHLFLA